MSSVQLDTSDPGKAANVAARAAVLFARVSGYLAENTKRENWGESVAYAAEAFEAAITDCFPELSGDSAERGSG